MGVLKRVGRSPVVLDLAGRLLAAYLRLVERTSAYVDASRGFHARVETEGWAPYIAVAWHGEHFLNHVPRRPGEDFRVLVSRHGDGEINAVAARRLGLGVVRGSGGSAAKTTSAKVAKRGGVPALRALLRALGEGASIAMTADVPKVPKRVGEGTVALARLSGRPVVPFAVVGRRRLRLRSWDRAAIGLPFSRLVFVAAAPVFVPADADARAREAARALIETRLDAAHAEAYRIADGGRMKPDAQALFDRSFDPSARKDRSGDD